MAIDAATEEIRTTSGDAAHSDEMGSKMASSSCMLLAGATEHRKTSELLLEEEKSSSASVIIEAEPTEIFYATNPSGVISRGKDSMVDCDQVVIAS